MAQVSLRQSEQRLQLALDGADLGMWDWNMRTDNVYFSPRYLSMLGYGPTELPHTLATWENLLHPEDKELGKQQILSCVEKGQSQWSLEFRLRAKDGQYVWILGRGKIVKFSQGGSPLRAAGTHLDITEKHQLEEKVLETVRLQEECKRLESLRTMAGAIAHRFNNSM